MNIELKPLILFYLFRVIVINGVRCLRVSGDLEGEKYFFSNKEAKYLIGNRSNRTTYSGYWKASGTDKQITSSSSRNSSNEVVGMKKTLVFYRGKPPYDSRTDWVMHEYRLIINAATSHPKTAPSVRSLTFT